MSVIEVDFPGNIAAVRTIADLRALPSASFSVNELYVVTGKGLYSWVPDSLATDDGDRVLKPNDLTPLQAGRWLFGPQGTTGPADNTYTTLAALLASDPMRKSARLVPQAGETEPAGNFAYLNGAWVRQQADGITFTAAGATVPVRPAQVKLRERVSILDYKLANEPDYTNALVRALSTNKEVFFPAGDYPVAVGPDFVAMKTANAGQEIPVVQLVGEGRGRSRILFTGGGSFLRGGHTIVTNGYTQSLILDGLSLIGTGIRGNSLALTYGEFTTTQNNGFAGSSSTQIAIEWEFDAASSIRNCEIAQFGTAIRTKLGYGYTIAENHIRYNMVALDLRAATTTANVVGNVIERNGIGVFLWIASLIHFEQNAIQGNYAGADVVSYNWNTLISFVRNYFEASPHVFVQNGDSAGQFTSNNYLFHGNKGLEVDIVDNLQFASFVRNRMISFKVGLPNVGRIIVEDNTTDANDGLTPFTNYTGDGAVNILYKDAPMKTVQGYDPPSLAPGASDGGVNVIVSGAAQGNAATATLSTIQPGVNISAIVTADDTVQVRLMNESGSTVDMTPGILRVTVRRV